MNFKLITELPSWWLVVCLVGAVAAAWLLYRRDNSLEGISIWWKRLLFVLRSLALFILAVLLLTPLIKTFVREKEKPLLIIAQDNSESVILNTDSAFYTNPAEGYQPELKKLADDLQDKFDVRTLSWGDRIKDGFEFSYADKQTDFSTLLKQLGVRFENRNVGAMIIASDGLYNRGGSPLYESGLKVPIYTIALGDTTVQKDLLVSRVNYNKVVYAGNVFPIEITVQARQCSREKTTVTVYEDSVMLFSREVTISGNRFSQLVPVKLEAGKPGIHQYSIRLSTLEGEMTILNNRRDITVEVVESKQKILIVGNAPHPDLGALKLGIESSQNYSARVVLANQDVALGEYNLVILHNLPSAVNPCRDILQELKTKKIPVWYIVGTQTSLTLFNNAQTGLNIGGAGDKTNAVNGVINTNFTRFTISDEVVRVMPLLPPLVGPFGDYRETMENSILLYQRIGVITTDDPLQLFMEENGERRGVLCGEGIWRWRLGDYALNNNYQVFHEWLLKTIQNLSIRENRSHFRLINKNSFAENEPITFDAEVYNDNYELINFPDVTLTLINESDKSFPYTFSKTEKAYTLNVGYLPAGKYRYKASVNAGGKVYQSSGEISVTALQVEQAETVADHGLLNALADKNGGKMYYPDQLDQLAKELQARDDMKTVTYSHYKLRDLVEWKLIFYIVLFLLSIEWFIRKRAGSY